MGAKVGVCTNSREQVSNEKNAENNNVYENMPIEPTTPANHRPKFNDITNEDNQIVNVQRNKAINLAGIANLAHNIDVQNLTDIFNSYATKKTFATGFFNLALVATNFAEMKQLIAPSRGGEQTQWNALNIVLMTFIGLSLLLQFVVGIMLVFLAKQGEFIDENKRNQLIRSNNVATLLVIAISIINIFINVFISI